MSRTSFQQTKDFSKQVVDYFDVGKDASRFASVTYGSSVTLDFDFDYSFYGSTVKNKIQAIPYRGGGTATWLALDLAKKMYTSTSYGSRPTKDGVSRVAILLTDGRSSSQAYTVAAANRLKAENVNIFTIGLGRYVR